MGLRIRPGQTLADAKSMVPDLVTFDDDPSADRRLLESLAVRAGCWSPLVHIEGDDTLILDITGCMPLFSSEEHLLRCAIDDMTAEGFTVRGSVADTPGAAWALAHAHPEPAFVSQVGQAAPDLAPLPVWSLRIDAACAKSLALVGVETVASLWHLPRASLASRFGEALLTRIDQALGETPEVLTPHRPKPTMTSRCHFGAPTTRMDTLQEGIRQVLERFCDDLARRVAGVRQMFVTFYCPDVEGEHGRETKAVTLPVSLSQPTRSATHLYKLLVVLLDGLRLPAPADSLCLWTSEIEKLDGWQDGLFATDAGDARQLGDLVDRLTVRLGSQRVVRPELVSEHQPERAFRYVPPGRGQVAKRRSGAATAAGSCGLNPPDDTAPPGPRPLRLLPSPVEIAATAIVPEGPPIVFCLRGDRHAVAKSVGPERIETGWWRGPHLRRDYYRVTTDGGRRCWLFRDRDADRWFLHGWFD